MPRKNFNAGRSATASAVNTPAQIAANKKRKKATKKTRRKKKS